MASKELKVRGAPVMAYSASEQPGDAVALLTGGRYTAAFLRDVADALDAWDSKALGGEVVVDGAKLAAEMDRYFGRTA